MRERLASEGLSFWYYDPPRATRPLAFSGEILSQVVDIPAAEVGSVVFVPLPGSAGRGAWLRPNRMDLYVVLDRDDRVVGAQTHTYPRKAAWEQLIP